MSRNQGRALGTAYAVASVAGVAFFALSAVLLGVWPGRVLARQTATMAPAHALPLTPSEARGRRIYSREGCAYCHTQQVRYLAADVRRFGSPTLAWETRFDYPHLWGTRRIGPDLARAGGTRSVDWQYTHLYAPRSVVPGSVMPAYAALFDGAPDRPLQAARDLVAYIETLGRARELAGPEGDAAARKACNCPDDAMADMALPRAPVNVHPARARRSGDAPLLPVDADLARGQALYHERCAPCHGSGGAGDGPGAPGLVPRPTRLTEHDYTQARLAQVLWNGVAGTAMPAWRDHAPADLAAIAAAVRAFRNGRDDAPAAGPALDAGAAVYGMHCAQCHGAEGGGDGTAAASLVVAPTSFRAQRPSLAAALEALRNGVAGTDMAAWTARLSEPELIAVSHYVRSLYRDPDDRAAANVR